MARVEEYRTSCGRSHGLTERGVERSRLSKVTSWALVRRSPRLGLAEMSHVTAPGGRCPTECKDCMNCRPSRSVMMEKRRGRSRADRATCVLLAASTSSAPASAVGTQRPCILYPRIPIWIARPIRGTQTGIFSGNVRHCRRLLRLQCCRTAAGGRRKATPPMGAGELRKFGRLPRFDIPPPSLTGPHPKLRGNMDRGQAENMLPSSSWTFRRL